MPGRDARIGSRIASPTHSYAACGGIQPAWIVLTHVFNFVYQTHCLIVKMQARPVSSTANLCVMCCMCEAYNAYKQCTLGMAEAVVVKRARDKDGMYIQGYTCIYCDNEAVVNNSSVPSHA